MARVTYLLLAANLLVFGLELLIGDPFVLAFALWPPGAGFEPWQVVTSAFLHGGLAHLGANMFGLWMFGRDVERALGAGRFLWLYFSSLLAASAAQVATTWLLHQHVPTLGASGAVFGVLAAFAMLYPRRIIILLIPPIPLPAPLFVFLYALFELFAGVTGTQAGVAHFAHLGGLAGGIFTVRHWRRRLRRH
ncbi:MAG: rhomboid family intramembrane serine protease [Nevskia sp.]|nr:rhomboid family intramembrane serine protease [Nevskia sp.]